MTGTGLVYWRQNKPHKNQFNQKSGSISHQIDHLPLRELQLWKYKNNFDFFLNGCTVCKHIFFWSRKIIFSCLTNVSFLQSWPQKMDYEEDNPYNLQQRTRRTTTCAKKSLLQFLLCYFVWPMLKMDKESNCPIVLK